ncbi:MAG: 6-phosphogluconolactonase [bacterium]
MKLYYSTDPKIAVFTSLFESLVIHKTKHINVFLSGGSAIGIYKYAVDKIDSIISLAKNVGLDDLSHVTFTFSDERWFLDKDDMNINYNLISNSGLFQTYSNQLSCRVVSIVNSNSLISDAEKLNQYLQDNFSNSYNLLIAGIGSDGHTCSIFPCENVEDFNFKYPDNKYAVSLTADNQFKERITITPKTISLMDEIMVYVAGEEKKSILKNIIFDDLPEYVLPGKLLLKNKNCGIYTDIII